MNKKTFKKRLRIMEGLYERSLKYRDDYLPENYNQTFRCWDCFKEKNRKLFPYRKQYKFNKEKRCKQCNKENGSFRRIFLNKKQIFNRIIISSKYYAKKRGENPKRQECKNFELDLPFIEYLYQKQNGKCALSGRQLTLDLNSHNKVSIDRKDSTKGYTKDNVQLTTFIANQCKNNMNEEDFKELIRDIYLHLGLNRYKNHSSFDNDSFIHKNRIKLLQKEVNKKNKKELLKRTSDEKNININDQNKKKCVDCNIIVNNKSIRCNTCNNKFRFVQNKNNRPSYEELLKDKEQLIYNTKIGKKYNVSDNTIRKWFALYKKYNL